MFGDWDKYLAVFLCGLLVTYCLTPLVRWGAIRLGVVDLPNARRPHKQPTARGGGLAVVIGTHAALLVALLLPWGELSNSLDFHWWTRFALASVVLLVVGIWDDVRGLRPLIKLGGQTLAALLIALSGARFDNIFGWHIPGVIDCALVVFWLVAVINAFNLIDGLDGLASSLAVISAVGLCGIFVIGCMPGNVLIMLALIGACLGFLRYNFHPASIFLGDTGSMFLGFILGAVSLQTFTKNTFLLSLTIPLLVLGVPIYDTLLAIWRRSIRLWLSNHQVPGSVKSAGLMQPDLDHLHHRLLKSGLSTPGVASVLCILNGGLVLCGLLLTCFQSYSAGIFLIALLAGAYVLFRHLAVLELMDTGRAILSGLRRPRKANLVAMAYPFWDMVWMSASVGVAMWAFESWRVNFWHTWFLDLPIWVTPTFSLLAASRVYVTNWPRARVVDVGVLMLRLWSGLLLSLGIALLVDPGQAHKWALRAVVVGAISHPMVIGIRLLYRIVEDFLPYVRGKNDASHSAQRILLYGAGGRCQLFLKERGFLNSSSFDNRLIVGLIDDDPSLQHLWVYGFPVCGTRQDLPLLLASEHITGIVLTTGALTPDSRRSVEALAAQHGVALSEWCFQERQLEPFQPAAALQPQQSTAGSSVSEAGIA